MSLLEMAPSDEAGPCELPVTPKGLAGATDHHAAAEIVVRLLYEDRVACARPMRPAFATGQSFLLIDAATGAP